MVILFERKHQHVILKRMFVFNYAFDDPITTSLSSSSSLTPPPKRPLKSYINDPNSLIIFPPEGNTLHLIYKLQLEEYGCNSLTM